MRPRILSGSRVTVGPIPYNEMPTEGDIVLVKVRGRVLLHLVKSVRGTAKKGEVLIGNNHGGINGWAGRDAIYGRVIAIEPPK